MLIQAIVGVPVWQTHAPCSSSLSKDCSASAPICWEITAGHALPRHGDDSLSWQAAQTCNILLFDEIATTTTYLSSLAKVGPLMTAPPEMCRPEIGRLANQLTFSGWVPDSPEGPIDLPYCIGHWHAQTLKQYSFPSQ